jgi:hypothetical protein
MAKRKPPSEIVGSLRSPGEREHAPQQLPAGSSWAAGDARRGEARVLFDKLFQATLDREGLEEGELIRFTDADGELHYRCPQRGVFTIELKLTRPGRIVRFKGQFPRDEQVWYLLMVAEYCNSLLDDPTSKQRELA